MKKNLSRCLLIFTHVSIVMLRAEYSQVLLQEPYDYINFMRDEHDDQSHWSLWGTGYTQFANKTYSCDGKHIAPLSTVFFGKLCFQLREAFADSIVIGPSNPWINVTCLCPTLDYSDKGVQLNFEYGRDTHFRSKRMRVGVRALLPIKSITINRCYTTLDTEAEATNLNAVRSLTTDTVAPGKTINNSFAYRLDFLSSLVLNQQGDLLVNYSKVPLSINGVNDVTETNHSPINVLRKTDGQLPPTPYAAIQTTVDATPFLTAHGTGVGNNGRARFKSTTSYEPLSTDMNAQKQLWVVPTAIPDDAGGYKLSGGAGDIETSVERLVGYQIDNSIVDYFSNNNINFLSQSQSGLGDLNTQLYFLFGWPHTIAWTELNCAFVFPTGKKFNNPLVLLGQPLGNNGHVEIGPGIDMGWYALDWLSLHALANYNFVLRAQEAVATPFCGACVKNIGPCTWAQISWQYINASIDMMFTDPYRHQFGFTVGYNFYFKRPDQVTFCGCMATDFEGTEQTIDPCVITRLTRIVSHKIKGEFFFSRSIGAIYGGFAYAVAGKNMPIETSIYAGLAVEF